MVVVQTFIFGRLQLWALLAALLCSLEPLALTVALTVGDSAVMAARFLAQATALVPHAQRVLIALVLIGVLPAAFWCARAVRANAAHAWFHPALCGGLQRATLAFARTNSRVPLASWSVSAACLVRVVRCAAILAFTRCGVALTDHHCAALGGRCDLRAVRLARTIGVRRALLACSSTFGRGQVLALLLAREGSVVERRGAFWIGLASGAILERLTLGHARAASVVPLAFGTVLGAGSWVVVALWARRLALLCVRIEFASR